MGEEKQPEKSRCCLEYDELLEFYEKHYFHEVDMREKHLARVQISLAMFVAICSLLSYMLSNIKTFSWEVWICIAFVVAMVLCAGSLGVALNFFLKSFFNYTYRFIPTAMVTEDYRLKLIDTYKSYDECDDLVRKYFKQYLSDTYIQCTTVNSENNELRSAHFHNTIKFIIPAFVFALASLMFFYLGKINKEEQKETKVKITSPIEIKEGFPNVRQQPTSQTANKSATASNATASKTDKRRLRNNTTWICREQEAMTDKNNNQDKPVPPPPPPAPTARSIKDSEGGK